jgi:hypothetical protein
MALLPDKISQEGRKERGIYVKNRTLIYACAVGVKSSLTEQNECTRRGEGKC